MAEIEYLVYYKDNGKYRTFNGIEFSTLHSIHNLRVNFFLMHKSYDKIDDNLTLYHKNIKIWSEQIKSKFTQCKFDYVSKFKDTKAVEHFCLLFCKKHIKTHDPISFTEQQWIEKCNNIGLMTCKPNEKAEKMYSYDGKGFYQMILARDDFMIPDKEGYETTLEKLPKLSQLKHGYYHVKITSRNPLAKLVFAFNSDDIYYYYDVAFALHHKIALNFEFEMVSSRGTNASADAGRASARVVKDNKPNAYLYDSIVSASDIFDKWNDMILDLKREFPDNKLIKNLGSTCWGAMSERCQFQVNDQELDDNFDKYKNCDIIRTKKYGEWGNDDYREVHTLQDPEKPYKHNIRLKAQITSFARAFIGNIGMQDIHHLARIHTDSLSFTRPKSLDNTDFNKKLFKKELKTSGLIRFHSCTKYRHQCWKCKEEFKYDDYKDHKCW